MEDAHVIPLNLQTAQGSLEQFKQLNRTGFVGESIF